MPVIALTPAQIAAALTSGFRLSAAQFTFSIPGVGSTWETTAGNYVNGSSGNNQPFTSYSTLNAAQTSAFIAAMNLWDRLIAPNFTQVADDANGHGEIRVAFTSSGMAGNTAAYAFQGSNQTPTSIIGDIWVNSNSTGQGFAAGTDNYITFLHEIGHTLGLKHPFEGTTLPAPYENARYSLMSYSPTTPYFARGFASTSGGGITTTTTRIMATTPMVLDIAAIQSIYGADTTTATGNDTYVLNQSSTEIQTIYDAGGTDTWDLSASTRNSIIDLRPGSMSSIGYWTIAEQIVYWQAQFPGFNNFISNQLNNGDTQNQTGWYEWKDNVGIAFSTVIENVIGGSGNETITGNDVANLINLSKGGNDIVDAGAGNDGIYFGGAFTAADQVDGGAGTLDQVALQGNYAAAVTLTATSLVNVEQVVLMSGADTSYGDVSGGFYSYNLVLNDANIAAGQTLSFSANTLRAGENFTLNAAAETNGSIVTYGGAGTDVITGGAQNDGFFFGVGLWGSNDQVNGGGGTLDQLAIQGNYSGGNAIVFGASQVVGIENLVLLSASDQRFGNGGASFSYTLTMNDANVAAGASLAVSANTLVAGEVLNLNATAETNGTYTVYGGGGNDVIRLGSGNDTIYGGGGGDQLSGGAGNDIFAYRVIGDSSISSSDAINDFATGDRIDLSLVDANTLQGGSQQFSLTTNPVLLAGQLRIISGGGTSYTIEGETDGALGVDFRIFVNSDHALTAADFIGLAGSTAQPAQDVVIGISQPDLVMVIDDHAGVPATPDEAVLLPQAAPAPTMASVTMDAFVSHLADTPIDLSQTFAPDVHSGFVGPGELWRFFVEIPVTGV